ncbi:MAG TPA: peptidylprolyl isomerase [bacterium]|nr:peptidylprolyl isomerase [bacterium]
METLQKEMGKIDVVVLDTSLGTIEIALFPEKAPVTVKNFLQYVDDSFYDGTIFHRVIPQFVVQGGGMTPDLNPKETRDPIKNEATNGLKNTRGTIAMARTGVVDSATSQFFINVVDNQRLDHKDDTVRGFGYAVFGKVVSGMDVVDKIVSVETDGQFQDPDKRRRLYQNVPKEPIIIKSIRRK